MTENQGNLKRAKVTCHGRFDTKLNINGSKHEVTIKFVADQRTIDLNVLARILKDGATAVFISDQTEFPVDKDESKPAKGQLSLLDGKEASNG